jgi:hypothetical protein
MSRYPAFLALTLTFFVPPAVAATGQWIVVVAPGLQNEIAPLAAARKAQGWEVTVIPSAADPAPARQQIAALAAKAQPVCVVLAGDFGGAGAGEFAVPAGKGTHLRMKDEPADLPWIAAVKNTPVELGRLPARSAAEARTMVAKILAWPAAFPPDQTFPVARLLAGHHAAPPAFEKIADNLTNALAARLIGQLPAAWQLDAAVHVDGSPWQVSGADIRAAATRMMSSRSTLLAYMGHSGPQTAVSKNFAFFDLPAWRSLPENTPRPGLFFTCGCYSCQVHPDLESYGLTAIRAPGGPPAVIGAHGESWSAMGYLAMSGVTSMLASGPAPTRVGQFWRAAQLGLEKGEINPTEFAMLDMADGTRGKVPLDQQRLEHLEMWMLLGDPAMSLLPPAPAITINEPAAPAPGMPLTLAGTLPENLSGATLRITFERHPGVTPANLPEVPADGGDRRKIARERRRLAGDVVLVSTEVKAEGGKFSASLPLPATLPDKPWTVRVTAPGTGAVLQIK